MSFSKMGKVFPDVSPDHRYAKVVSGALRDELGESHHAIKTVMSWTGANERTVKNWFAGTNGPSGAHLIALAKHSNDIFDAFLLLSGRELSHEIPSSSLTALRERLVQALQIVESFTATH